MTKLQIVLPSSEGAKTIVGNPDFQNVEQGQLIYRMFEDNVQLAIDELHKSSIISGRFRYGKSDLSDLRKYLESHHEWSIIHVLIQYHKGTAIPIKG